MLFTACLLLGAGTLGSDATQQTPAPAWIDLDQDGIQDLVIRTAQGNLVLLRATAQGRFVDVSQSALASSSGKARVAAQPLPVCPDGLDDQANTAVCIKPSSTPSLGMLLPLGNPLFVMPTGNVGVGNSSPGQRLSVQGRLELLSGGLLFPDGTMLSTATPVGPQGIQGIPGPQGPQGPVGLQGAQGPITAMPSINQKTGAITIAGAGLVLVNTSAATGEVTLSIGPNKCNWGGKLYSPGAQCFVTPTHTGCSGGAWTATPKTCQTNLSWGTGTQVICQGQAPSPVCGQ